MAKFLISSASYIDGQLEVHPVYEKRYVSREEVIEFTQDCIAEAYGFMSWDEYLSQRDPQVIEKDGISYTYSIRDDYCGHSEMFLIEELIPDEEGEKVDG